MKMRFERPSMDVEQFMANEYIAACGDSGKTYLFDCNAGGGRDGGVWQESNGRPGLQVGRGGDKRISRSDHSFSACDKKHETTDPEDFLYNCYYAPYRYGFIGGEVLVDQAVDVIVWRGEKGNNVHCTTDLDIDSWETLKS